MTTGYAHLGVPLQWYLGCRSITQALLALGRGRTWGIVSHGAKMGLHVASVWRLWRTHVHMALRYSKDHNNRSPPLTFRTYQILPLTSMARSGIAGTTRCPVSDPSAEDGSRCVFCASQSREMGAGRFQISPTHQFGKPGVRKSGKRVRHRQRAVHRNHHCVFFSAPNVCIAACPPPEGRRRCVFLPARAVA